MNTLISTEGADSADAGTPPAWRMPTAAFRARQATHLLTREQRAAVARRPRFYSLPWLRRADEPDPDDLIP